MALPTETVYGLAGNAFSEPAVSAIYSQKSRPKNHPLILHIAQSDDIYKYTSCKHPALQILIEHFWPGPLSFIVKQKDILSLVRANLNTVAIRCPDHPLFQEILEKLDFPLVAPSANPFKKTSPTCAQQVQDFFPHLPILDGGDCKIGIESTTLKIDTYSNSLHLSILRPGSITQEDICTALEAHNVSYKWISNSNSAHSPGMIEDHYQPEKKLVLNQESPFSWDKLSHLGIKDLQKVKKIQISKNPQTAIKNMYQVLWQHSKETETELLLIDIYKQKNQRQWQALINRLQKAASYRI